jgi:hypothetical protein
LEQQYHRKFRFPRTLWDVVAMPSGGLQRYFGAGGCDESLTLRLQRLNKTRTASGDDGKRCQHLGGLKRLVVSRRASDINTVAWGTSMPPQTSTPALASRGSSGW